MPGNQNDANDHNGIHGLHAFSALATNARLFIARYALALIPIRIIGEVDAPGCKAEASTEEVGERVRRTGVKR